MDQKVDIKEEPAWLEGTASTSFDNDELASQKVHLNEETKSELTEPGQTQMTTFEPFADVKDEILVERTLDQLVPFFKKEENMENIGILIKHPVPLCDKKLKQKVHMNCQLLTGTKRPLPSCHSTDNPAFIHGRYPENHLQLRSTPRPSSCAIRNISVKQIHPGTLSQCHSGEGLPFCSTCNSVFPRTGLLKYQRRIYTAPKPFCCSECNYNCSTKQHLGLHLRIHSGETAQKRINCSECNYVCVTKHHLVIHLRTHSGERPFHCSMCKSKFARKGDLLRHMQTHSGERPFLCSICEKMFGRKSDLKRHILHSCLFN